MNNKEVIVVLAYLDDGEGGYIITGICEDKNMITQKMLDNGMLNTKAVMVRLNHVIDRDLLELDNIL